jgi:hypothetical protein
MPTSTPQDFIDNIGKRVLLSGTASNSASTEAIIVEVSNTGQVKWTEITHDGRPASTRWTHFGSIAIVDVLPAKGPIQLAQDAAQQAQEEAGKHLDAKVAAEKAHEALKAAHATELANLKAAHQTEVDVLNSKMPIASKVGLPDPSLPTRASHPDRVYVPTVKTPPTLETT